MLRAIEFYIETVSVLAWYDFILYSLPFLLLMAYGYQQHKKLNK